MSYLPSFLRRNEKGKIVSAEVPADLHASWESLSPSGGGAKQGAPRSPQRIAHLNLKGSRRMENLVGELGDTPCPWTETVRPMTMLGWLKSECREVAVEIRETMRNPGSNLENLKNELGDILFDAHMLNMICARDFGFGRDEAFDIGCKKVERRTPYMKSWGDGTVAETREDAETIWQTIKKIEKQEAAAEAEAGTADEGKGNTAVPAQSIKETIARIYEDAQLDEGTNTLLLAGAWLAGVGCGVLGVKLIQGRGGVKATA
mmetsp:Transcript_19951/g.41692  ORF Transcript_19951/g.41692 Transcript_19951/m.41692 type:complete len:261 (+) Transcript_19951:199-981(+)